MLIVVILLCGVMNIFFFSFSFFSIETRRGEGFFLCYYSAKKVLLLVVVLLVGVVVLLLLGLADILAVLRKNFLSFNRNQKGGIILLLCWWS